MAQAETIQIKVPSTLKRALALKAAEQQTTMRALVLKALAEAGYEIADGELHDKRKLQR